MQQKIQTQKQAKCNSERFICAHSEIEPPFLILVFYRYSHCCSNYTNILP